MSRRFGVTSNVLAVLAHSIAPSIPNLHNLDPDQFLCLRNRRGLDTTVVSSTELYGALARIGSEGLSMHMSRAYGAFFEY